MTLGVYRSTLQKVLIAGESLLSVQRVDGLSNQVYKVATSSRTLYLKVYGKLFPEFMNRRAELQVYKAAASIGLGPRVLYEDSHIKIESQLSGRRLSNIQILQPDKWNSLASSLAKLHSLQLQPTSPIVSRGDVTQLFLNSTDLVLNRISEFSREKRELGTQAVGMLVQYGRKYLREMKGWQRRLCHYDLNDGNLLWGQGQVKLLDFEFSCFSAPEIDLANAFVERNIEYCTPSAPFFKYEDKVSTEQRLAFIETYLRVGTRQQGVAALLQRVRKAEGLVLIFHCYLTLLSLEADLQIDMTALLQLRLRLLAKITSAEFQQ